MKTAPYFLLTLLLAGSAQAAVVDHFKCKITATNSDGTPMFSSEMDAYATRMIIGSQPNPTGWTSLASVQLKAAGPNEYRAALGLRYQHAVLNGPDGKPSRARQSFCMISETASDHVGTISGCLVASADAFSPDAIGWEDTSLVNGVPVFNVQALRPRTSQLDLNKFTFSCDHLGTEQ